MQPANSEPTIPLDPGLFRIRKCRHGWMVFLHADDTIGRCLDLYGEFAEAENRVLLPLVHPGDTVIDVGANVGTVTLPLARALGPLGQVHAFEPQRLVFQALCTALVLNGLTNVHAHPLAVGSNPGTARIPPIDPRKHCNFGAVHLRSDDGAGERVPIVTIDSLDLPHCALVKIDAEGMDHLVLLGAATTVSRLRPYLYLEAKPGQGTSQIIASLLERNYRCYWHFAPFCSADNFRGVADNEFGGRGDINLLAVPAERSVVAHLPEVRGPQADWQQDYAAYKAAAI